MIIALTTPIEIDGHLYPQMTFSLACSTKYTAADTLSGNVALRLVPVRFDEAGIQVDAPASGHILISAQDMAKHPDRNMVEIASAIVGIMQTLVTTVLRL